MGHDLKLQTLTQDRPPSVTDVVYGQLYDSIVGLHMPPGTKMSEADVAKKLGVSRQPVRDAFYRLSQQGFLLIRPQRATVVTKISTAAVHKARFIRTALELETTCTAMKKATPADIARLEDNLEKQKSAISDENRERFHELDDAFHAQLCAIAGHPEVWTLIKDNKAHMDRVRYLSLDREGSQIAFDEHVEILKAMKSKDKNHVIELMRAHLNRIAKSINTIHAAHTEFFEEDDHEN
ncbi:GntR family transcriptional regulator [Pacificibacter marinus]|jgi:GntR family transcriptional regulator, rspAB operon transcriptional repressor|uniref:Putative HTH-type transcriptional regulator YdfH n=1 Tax=Pacificibacter marinus TaxID=658057 RepID=A0A1Y5RW05_9RHOB|nr:GntR family transcriptional regulator [Pacificibacter marinus]SEK43101.1 transcriptional regulator, GntR family [Pacificibacter marinus]SLN23852.1 putative HTH-type transcriptional regulator YdfH [Pacificibacter marinus]